MGKRNCEELGHNYDSWMITEDEKSAFRICKDCGFQRILPMNEDLRKQIKKQKEASLFLKAFQLVQADDKMSVGYLNLMLDEYIYSLSSKEQELLLVKMKEIAESNMVSTENAIQISCLYSDFQEGNIEAFEDHLEQFQAYNESYFKSMLEESRLGFHH